MTPRPVCRGATLYYVTAVAAGGVIYLRVFRGWRLVDMMYVTSASLKKSVGQLSEGECLLSPVLGHGLQPRQRLCTLCAEMHIS